MKNNHALLTLVIPIFLLSTIISCKKSAPATPLTVSSSTAAHGGGGGTVNIQGTGFAAIANDQVTINGVAATVTQASSTQLTFTVPVRAGSGPITVTVNGVKVNGPNFIYDTVWSVSTFAGGTQGSADGTGAAAQFNYPGGLCIDGSGNLYVTESAGNRVRKITPAGVVTTLAGGTKGTADGQGAAAAFNEPFAICIDPTGTLFVADAGSKSIRKISASGVVTTLVSPSPGFSFGFPDGMCADGQGNLFVTDQYLDIVARVDANNGGTPTIFAGTSSYPADKDGTGTGAELAFPAGICMDAQKNMYVAELNQNIRKITPAGVVTTISGIVNPYYLCMDARQRLFVSGFGGTWVSEISAAGTISQIAGGNGPGSANGIGSAASFSQVAGIAVDAAGDLYVADGGNNSIRKISWQ